MRIKRGEKKKYQKVLGGNAGPVSSFLHIYSFVCPRSYFTGLRNKKELKSSCFTT